MARESAEMKGLMLRMPESLRQRLEQEAKQHGRSMNAEILFLWEESLSGAALHRLLEKLSADQLTTLSRFGGAIQEHLIRADERQKGAWEDVLRRLDEVLDILKPDDRGGGSFAGA